MIGHLLTRGLVMILGYAYPAYECFKTVEKNKPDIEQLRFWCQYWILVALMTVFERVGDTFISWIPMYGEAKLAFIIFLWYPKTKGTTYVYESFFRPYIAKHETDIDRNLMELRTRAGDMAFIYFQKVAIYGQTRIFEVLQFVAAQSTPRPRPAQPQPAVARPRQPPVTTAPKQPPSKAHVPQPQNEEPPSPTSSTSSTRQEKEVEEDLKRPSASVPAPGKVSTPPKKSALTSTARPPASSPLKKSVPLPLAPVPAPAPAPAPAPTVASESSSQSTADESEAIQKTEKDPANPKVEKSVAKSPQDTVMEETIRVTRGRLRTRSMANQLKQGPTVSGN